MSRNVTQLTEIASRLAESDHLDSLTGVENRNHFHDHLEQMLQREGGGYVLLTKCNVSRFHHINTSFGYDVGDALLIQVGQRLRTLPDAVIGRLSGDEFAVALPLSAGICPRKRLSAFENCLPQSSCCQAPQSMSDFRSVTQSGGSGMTVSGYFGRPASHCTNRSCRHSPIQLNSTEMQRSGLRAKRA
jgi:GGDEF domain-containing protein